MTPQTVSGYICSSESIDQVPVPVDQFLSQKPHLPPWGGWSVQSQRQAVPATQVEDRTFSPAPVGV